MGYSSVPNTNRLMRTGQWVSVKSRVGRWQTTQPLVLWTVTKTDLLTLMIRMPPPALCCLLLCK